MLKSVACSVTLQLDVQLSLLFVFVRGVFAIFLSISVSNVSISVSNVSISVSNVSISVSNVSNVTATRLPHSEGHVARSPRPGTWLVNRL
jgi:hypothetical protein